MDYIFSHNCDILEVTVSLAQPGIAVHQYTRKQEHSQLTKDQSKYQAMQNDQAHRYSCELQCIHRKFKWHAKK